MPETAYVPDPKGSFSFLDFEDTEAGENSSVDVTVNTTAGSASTASTLAGRVRVAQNNQTYLLTNNLITSSSVVLATINTDDNQVTSVKAVPGSGKIDFVFSDSTANDMDVSWFVINP